VLLAASDNIKQLALLPSELSHLRDDPRHAARLLERIRLDP
jgi:hypothetical protein